MAEGMLTMLSQWQRSSRKDNFLFFIYLIQMYAVATQIFFIIYNENSILYKQKQHVSTDFGCL